MGMKNLEESRPGFMKNWLNEKQYFEKVTSEVPVKWKNSRGLIRILQERIERKSGYYKQALPGVPRRRVSLQWKIIPRSQSTGSRSKSLCDAEPGRLRSDTWNLLVHRETFLAIHVQWSIRHRHLIKQSFTLHQPFRQSVAERVTRRLPRMTGFFSL